MTPKQKDCLDYLRWYIKHHGFAPTVREIQIGTSSASISGVSEMLGRLERDGYITRTPNKARGLALIEDPWVQVHTAAERLLDSIKGEDINEVGEGTVEVDAAALGELDAALAEAKAETKEGAAGNG